MSTDFVIQLDQFLKLMAIVQTGGQAKMLIQDGQVKLNGKVETRRGKKLVEGDRVTVMGSTFTVNASTLSDQSGSSQ